MSKPDLRALHPGVWRATEVAPLPGGRCLPAGWPSLQAVLPGGGWPRDGLTEILAACPGVGELSLLAPAWPATAPAARPVLLVQPPHPPHIAAWQGWGVAPQRLFWLRPPRPADGVWAVEQALRSGSCAAILLWQHPLSLAALRRLQLAAAESDTVCVLCRPLSAATVPSPAVLRVQVAPQPDGLQVSVLKRRGPPLPQPLLLRWPGDALHDSPRPKPARSPTATPLATPQPVLHASA